jgi:Zn-dependent protease
MFPELNLAQEFAVWVVPVLFAITLHEVAHGWVARALGDPTADRMGRLTLNPLRHVDPVGTLLVPGILLALKTGFLFGWAKPVPVNPHNLRRGRADMALVAVAGPGANLAMALGWGLLLKLAGAQGGDGVWQYLMYVGTAGMIINIILMVLNLLPIPPLDGSRVLAGFLSERHARTLDRIEPYGLFILVGLLAVGWLGVLLGPALRFVFGLLSTVLGLR